MLDTLPIRISQNAKEILADNVNYARLNELTLKLYSPYIIINLSENDIKIGDQLSPKTISQYAGHAALLTSISNFFNKRIDILITTK